MREGERDKRRRKTGIARVKDMKHQVGREGSGEEEQRLRGMEGKEESGSASERERTKEWVEGR